MPDDEARRADRQCSAPCSRKSRVGTPARRPRLRLAFLACMDSRIDIFTMFGLSTGDAHVVRNAGGLVTDDVIRSLAISQRMLGTRQIIIVQHTGCGLLGVHDDAIRVGARERDGSPANLASRGIRRRERERPAIHPSPQVEPVHSTQRRGLRVRLRPGNPRSDRSRSHVTPDPPRGPRDGYR